MEESEEPHHNNPTSRKIRRVQTLQPKVPRLAKMRAEKVKPQWRERFLRHTASIDHTHIHRKIESKTELNKIKIKHTQGIIQSINQSIIHLLWIHHRSLSVTYRACRNLPRSTKRVRNRLCVEKKSSVRGLKIWEVEIGANLVRISREESKCPVHGSEILYGILQSKIAFITTKMHCWAFPAVQRG